MELEKIFKGIDYSLLQEGKSEDFVDINYDSRLIKKGDVFVALKGFSLDGHEYISNACENGASMIILEKEDINYPKNIYVILVKDLRKKLGIIASNFYNHPEEKLKIVGVTGTNGKTTTTYILESVLKNSTRVGTTGYKIKDEYFESKNTTPESLDIIKLMDKSVKKDVDYFIMEVSSHALCLGRVDMLKFDSAIFTNLTQDHLDYHKNMEEYFDAKASIANLLKQGKQLIVNKDDKYTNRLASKSKTFSLKEDANICGEILEYTLKGMKVKIKYQNEVYVFETKLMGEYNLSNILGAILSLIDLGFDIKDIVKEISLIKSVPGRFELIENDKDVIVIVDYAHTPDGLDNILKTLLKMKKGKIFTVFGAGGDRDKTKRPLMAEVVSKYSDFAYITSDNPRTEDPKKIMEDVEKGMLNERYVKIQNREEAIKQAINNLNKNDILLVAGKGHEDYQIIGKEKIHFDDKKVCIKYLGGK